MEHNRKNTTSFKTLETHKKLNGWQWYKKGERLVIGNIWQILNLATASLLNCDERKDSKQDILF